ncbi:hypothetical protein X975_25763, partial [Stegodyphus mimosarum]
INIILSSFFLMANGLGDSDHISLPRL